MLLRPPPSDVFRPRLPLDPFATIDPGPWRPALNPHAPPPAVVLVLGEPSHTDLSPIIASPFLLRSLVIFVCHAPPYIAGTPSPAVRILRLSHPLGHQDSGALHLVSLFERADRVVRQFRVSPVEQSRKLVQLAENAATGEFDVEETYSPTPPPMSSHATPDDDLLRRYPTPAPSISSSLSSESSTFSARSSSSSSSLPSILRHRQKNTDSGSAKASSGPPTDRIFDVIINFLPGSLPDKAILKHAILVSTVSASFLSAPPVPSSPFSAARGSGSKEPKAKQPVFSISTFSSSDANLKHSGTDSSASKKNPRRFSMLLKRRSDAHPGAEIVHSAPCSRDSLPLLPNGHAYDNYSRLRRKSKLANDFFLAQRQEKVHLVHILPAHVYPLRTRSNSAANLPGLAHPASRGSRTNRFSGIQNHSRQKPKLVQSLEQFLLAYGYPLQSVSSLSAFSASGNRTSMSAPGSRRVSSVSTLSSYMMMAPAPMAGDSQSQKPVPFLLPSGVFGASPKGMDENRMMVSIGELVMMGALDNGQQPDAAVFSSGGSDGHGRMQNAGDIGRVWIASGDDVVMEENVERWNDETPTPFSSVGHQNRAIQNHVPSSVHHPLSISAPHTLVKKACSSSTLPSPSHPGPIPYPITPRPSTGRSSLKHSTVSAELEMTAADMSPKSPSRLNSMIAQNDKVHQTRTETTVNDTSTIPKAAAKGGGDSGGHVDDVKTGKTGLPTPPDSASSLEDEVDVPGNTSDNTKAAGDHASKSEDSHHVHAHRHGEQTESLKETRGRGGFKKAIKSTSSRLKGLLVHGTRA